MLLCLHWLEDGDSRRLVPAGILLGLAILAKGLVPVVLALPVFWFGRRRWRELFLYAGFAVLVAAPWYVLCSLENGLPFLRVFFWEHQFSRLTSEALQHIQPFWFYVPVLLAGLLPWTPLVFLLGRRDFHESALRFLLVWFAFGFLFFSISTNKLPGYLLPLLPALATLTGIRLASARRASWPLAAVAALLAVVPVAGAILPEALNHGITMASIPSMPWWVLGPVAFVAVLSWWLDHAGLRHAAVVLLTASLIAALVSLKLTVLPVVDSTVSARGFWRQVLLSSDQVCIESATRDLVYGLNYYSMDSIPACSQSSRPLHIVQPDDSFPRLVPGDR
jgi:4-amino-4-deoxy-L-arabinose transferase-like glycosyltransferase